MVFDKSAKLFDEMPHEDPFWRESKSLNLSSNVKIQFINGKQEGKLMKNPEE